MYVALPPATLLYFSPTFPQSRYARPSLATHFTTAGTTSIGYQGTVIAAVDITGFDATGIISKEVRGGWKLTMGWGIR